MRIMASTIPPPAPLNGQGSSLRSTAKQVQRLAGKMDVSRFLIGLGLVILMAGLLWPFLERLGLGRLPGDIMVRREGFTFYFPIVTSLLISLILSLLFWFLRR